MKKFNIILFFLISFNVIGQISVSKFSLPQKGDILLTRLALNPNIDVGTTGGPQVWDFSSVAGGVEIQTELLDPSEGSVDVANADFLTKDGDFIEHYYRMDNNEDLIEFYLKTFDPLFNTYEISNYFLDPPTFRKASIYYGNEYESSSSFAAPIAVSDLPDTLASTLGLFDSIRFTSIVERKDEIDGYGMVKLPDGDWDVLREKTTLESQVNIAGYVGSIKQWLEIPISTVAAVLGDLAEVLEPRTSYEFNFYSDKAIEVIASVSSNNEDGTEPMQVEYKSGSTITSTKSYLSFEYEVTASPNPSYGPTDFDFGACPKGIYTIKIYNVLGKEMWQTNILNTGENSIFKRDLTGLSKGTYFYCVFNSNGNKIDTKRIAIMTP